jgi:hypothetical protein
MSADTLQSLSRSLAEIERRADESQVLISILDRKLCKQREFVTSARDALQQSTVINTLVNLEPIAKSAYRDAISTTGQLPGRIAVFHQGLSAAAIENPALNFDQRWNQMKETSPKLFWEFVLSFDTQGSISTALQTNNGVTT